MERKEQDHQQELDRLKQNAALEKARLIHEAKLKNNMAKVSGWIQVNFTQHLIETWKAVCMCVYYIQYIYTVKKKHSQIS